MTLVEEARHFLNNAQPEEALEILAPKLAENQNDIDFLSIFGETLLETNNLEEAYDVFIKAVELDPEAEKGVEKFLYLGQIIGGTDGMAYLEVGLNRLNQQLESEDDKAKIIKKLNQGIFAEIEIWMTDLCMEPEAESKCNDLIEYSIKLDNTNPEAHSLLSSIRISQQRNDEAIEALLNSWELFKSKKEKLQSELTDDSVNYELIELIQPLLTLCKFSIELEQYDTAVEISGVIQDINDQILEVYYYEALAYLFKFKLSYKNSGNKIENDYRELPNNLVDDDTKQDVRLSLTNAYKLIQTSDELDPEIKESINSLLSEFGGPLMSELLPARMDDNDDDWEDEIEE